MARNSISPQGVYNVICDRCGFKYKNTQLRKEWTGAMVCQGPATNDCWEPRHPQDLIRVRPENTKLPFVRPDTEGTLTYSPTWGLIDSVGDAEIRGDYTEYVETDGDKVINVFVRAILGSSTTYNSGTWTITAPITNGALAATGHAEVFLGHQWVRGDAALPAASNVITIRSTETREQWTDLIPIPWASGARFNMMIRYGTNT